MRCEWKQVKLGDVSTVKGGKRLPKNVNLISTPNTHPYIRVRDLNDSITLELNSDFLYVDDETQKGISRYIVNSGDIVISIVGTIGLVSKVGKTLDGANLTENCVKITNLQNIDKEYLFYYLKSDFGQQEIMRGIVGAVQQKLPIKNIQEITIKCPELIEQKKIAAILSALDEKIATNRAINDNLERQLRTIFKAEFTDNPELENITQIPLSELCHVVTKGTTPTTLGKPFVESGINFIKAESILDDHSIDKSKFAFIDEETNALLKRSIIHAGDVVFTIAGTLGRFALIDENVLPANTNQAVAIIRADVEKVLPEYIYTCFIGEWHTDYYAKRVQQAVQANLSLTTIKSLPIPLLDEAKMSEYLSLILPLIKAIKTNETQNEKLAASRDILLPKLMSGEIDVSAVQL